MLPNWTRLNVLEIGCGEGHLAAMMTMAGAHVDAIDYSREAIQKAEANFNGLKGVRFTCADYKRFISGKYDVVVMQGVLEHLDDPFDTLSDLIDRFLKRDGIVITSSPSFLNPRGYIWMLFELMFGVKMSMMDLHSLCPFDFTKYCNENNFSVDFKSCDYDWGGGVRTIEDYRKRFKSGIFKKKIKDKMGFDLTDEAIDRFLDWFTVAIIFFPHHNASGANIIYKITRKDNK